VSERNEERYHRQLDLVNISRLQETEFTVIGAGALGSFIAMVLAKMGAEHIRVFDNDKVEEHNLPMQFYRTEDLGKPKVEALKDIILQFEGVEIDARNSLFENGEDTEVTISAVDSIDAREKIFKEQMSRIGNLYIDSRAAGNIGSIFTVPLLDINCIEIYEKNLSDKDVYTAPCTARMTTYIAPAVAGQVGAIVASYCNDEDTGPFLRTFDMKNCLMINQSAEEHSQYYNSEQSAEE
jgi:hypothetical protein